MSGVETDLFEAVCHERDRLFEINAELRAAAVKWPRCCDLYQDGFGTFACLDCQQKTFAMMRKIQSILGVDKGGEVLIKAKS